MRSLQRLFRRLTRLESASHEAKLTRADAEDEAAREWQPPELCPEAEQARENLLQGIADQLAKEGVKKGEFVSLRRMREAMFNSPDCCELAHLAFEIQGMHEAKGREQAGVPVYGLKEIAENAPHVNNGTGEDEAIQAG
jgi:hypothetical protein